MSTESNKRLEFRRGGLTVSAGAGRHLVVAVKLSSFELRNLGRLQLLLPLLSLCHFLLIFVESLEVSSNDGDGEGEDEDPGHGAHGANKLTEAGCGVDVSISNGGHGDHHPVECSRYGGEARILHLCLDEVGKTGEDEAADADEKDEESELLVAVLECVGDGLKAGRVSGQLQYSRQLEDPEHLEDVFHSFTFVSRVLHG